VKGLPRSLSRSAAGSGGSGKTVPIKDLAIRTSGATGVGFGTAVIRGLPEGNILLLGAVAYLQFTKLDAGTLATFDGDFSIGSAPTADGTLSGAEIDIIPSTALGAATAGVSPMVRGANATQVMLDNTDGSLEVNLNLLLDDASVSADDQDFTVSGVLSLSYVVLGDD
jgi:hypothetical protein